MNDEVQRLCTVLACLEHSIAADKSDARRAALVVDRGATINRFNYLGARIIADREQLEKLGARKPTTKVTAADLERQRQKIASQIDTMVLERGRLGSVLDELETNSRKRFV